MLFILMGVSGSGKSSVGGAVAQRLGLRFFEGDEFHPRANVERMAARIPLTDDDRVPWIAALSRAVNDSCARNAVLACSALTDRVRVQLVREITQPITFIHLTGNAALIRERLRRRGQHFMKSGMLDSQIAALEHPRDAIAVDIDQPLSQVIERVEALVAARIEPS